VDISTLFLFGFLMVCFRVVDKQTSSLFPLYPTKNNEPANQNKLFTTLFIHTKIKTENKK